MVLLALEAAGLTEHLLEASKDSFFKPIGSTIHPPRMERSSVLGPGAALLYVRSWSGHGIIASQTGASRS